MKILLMRMSNSHITFALILILSTFIHLASEEIYIEKDKSQYLTGKFLQIKRNIHEYSKAVDKNGWMPNKEEIPNFGYTKEPIWFNITIRSDSFQKRILYFNTSVDLLQLYNEGSDRPIYQAGRTIPNQETRYPQYEISLTPEPVTYYIRLQSRDNFAFSLQIWDYKGFANSEFKENLLYGFFFGTLFIMAIYNLFIFITTREKSFFYYVVFTIFTLLFYFSVTGFSTIIFFPENPELYYKTNHVFAGLMVISLGFFSQSFLKLKDIVPSVNKIIIGLQITIVLSLVMTLLDSYSLNISGSLRSWSTIIATATVPIAAYLSYKRGNKSAIIFFYATILFLMTGLIYTLRSLGIIEQNFFTQHANKIASVIEIALFSFALSNRVNYLKKSLETAIWDLEVAHNELVKSETKYMSLVEDSGDLIFSLNNSGTIQTINKASRKILDLKPEQLIGKNFKNILYQSPEASHFYIDNLVREQFLLLDNGPVQFWVKILSKTSQPVDLFVTMERIGLGRDSFILGKGVVRQEDVLGEGLYSERGIYNIKNYLSNIDTINERVTRNLKKYFTEDDAEMIRLCLREMLINAVEHGNMEISFEEKSIAHNEGSYIELLITRQNAEPYCNRKVRVEYSLNSHRVAYRITDEGNGFDHKKMFKEERKRISDATLSHGRGIAMTRSLFDIVKYNQKGNQVLLIKRTDKKLNKN